MRMIDADALKPDMGFGQRDMYSQRAIDNAPTIVRRRGEWIPIPEHENKRCSACKAVFSDFTLGYFCGNCGAEMDNEA